MNALPVVVDAVRSAFALRSFRWLLAASTLLGVALGAIPLLAIHGVESAVALGALLPPLAAAAAARIAIAARRATSGSGSSLAGRALTAAGLLWLAPVCVLALNALRVRNCAPLEGLAFMLLGPGVGVVLAGLVGACAGALPLRPALATLLAVLVPVAGSVRALYGFYATPAVYAYGHFFGYFPGSLYDELVALPPQLVTLRLLTAAGCAALLCLLLAHYDPARRQLAARPQPGSGAVRALLGLAAASALLGELYGKELGHRTSVAFIAEALGGRDFSQHCELVVPRELARAKRRRIAADCDFRVEQLQRWFQLRQPGRVRVFVFRSADEKRALMGAAATNIAKPWRREIYLQDDVWPHPVMPHELAHILAGNTGRGPFRIAGLLGGWWPDFALIEGVAVAAAWASSSSSGLTPHQWTRAMIEQRIAPALGDVLDGGFLQQQSRVAYTLTGSLLRYVADTHGVAALRKLYAGGDVHEVLGFGVAELERRFHAFVLSVELPAPARALAQQRFAGKSILSSVCPHEKAKLGRELQGHLAAGDGRQAARTCRELLEIDPLENGARATLAAVLARSGDLRGAQAELTRLARPQAAPPPVVAGARLLIADEAWRAGRLAEARATYRELLSQPLDRDTQRLLQVKTLALDGSARERALLFALLVGEPGRPADGTYAVHIARELRTERRDGLPHYLEARQLYMRERFAEAATLLAQARSLGLPSAELATEALRLEAIASYGAGASEQARKLWRMLAAQNDLALRAEADDWLQRIALAR